MGFRALLGGLAALAWALPAWLALHRSGDPQVLGRYSWGYLALLAAAACPALLLSLSLGGPLHRWLRARRAALLLLLVFSLGSLTAAEALVRGLDPRGVSYYEEARRYMLAKQSDPELYQRDPPLQRARYQGVAVATNELGLRERPIAPRGHGELRLVFAGDSVTFGWGVPVEQVYVRLLEDRLQAHTARRVRTVNAGVGAYNSQSEYAQLRRHVDTLDPDVVILLYVGNDTDLTPEAAFDPRADTALRLGDPLTSIRLLVWRSWLYRLAQHGWKTRFRWSAGVPDAEPVTPAAATPPEGHPGWAASRAAVAGMARLAHERGARFGVVMFRDSAMPWLASLLAGLRELGRAESFPVADTLPWYSGLEPAELRNSAVDRHPNARGHALLAEGTERFLLESGLMIRETPR